MSEKGVFLNMETTDALHVMCPSGGTGVHDSPKGL